MSTYEEIEIWVNPAAWDDEAKARRVIDAIHDSGSDDEADWVRIAGGDQDDIAAAEGRGLDRDEARQAAAIDEAQVAAAADAYQQAEQELEAAREGVHQALREARAAGASAYRLAQLTGLSEKHVGRITKERKTDRPSHLTVR